MISQEQIEKAAKEFAATVSTSHRVLVDLYLGRNEYTSVTSIVKAAYIAGAQMVANTSKNTGG
jgi:hypothetical protein